MSTISSRHGDAVLWVVLGICGTYMAFGAARHLQAVRKASRVKQKPSQPNGISNATENAIKSETLNDLVSSPVYEIRQAAIKIIIERISRTNAYPMLLSNIKKPWKDPMQPPEEAAMALSSLRFLSYSVAAERFLTPVTFHAVLTYLTNAVHVATKREHQPHTDYRLRSSGEKHALEIMNILLRALPDPQLPPNLVSQWLTNYPFGGINAESDRKRTVVRQLSTSQTDDNSLGTILQHIHKDAGARKAMRDAGLISSNFTEHEDGLSIGDLVPAPNIMPEFEEQIRLLEMQDQSRLSALSSSQNDAAYNTDDAFDTDDPVGVGVAPPLRVREESPEEMALRRRRRQAMVINEGGPLGSSDIYGVY